MASKARPRWLNLWRLPVLDGRRRANCRTRRRHFVRLITRTTLPAPSPAGSRSPIFSARKTTSATWISSSPARPKGSPASTRPQDHGLPFEIAKKAIFQARDARSRSCARCSAPSLSRASSSAPTPADPDIQIDPEKIGLLIGPAQDIRRITETTGAQIDIARTIPARSNLFQQRRRDGPGRAGDRRPLWRWLAD